MPAQTQKPTARSTGTVITGTRTIAGRFRRRGWSKNKGAPGTHAVPARFNSTGLVRRRIWVPELKRFVVVRLTARALRELRKKGAFTTLKKAGIIPDSWFDQIVAKPSKSGGHATIKKRQPQLPEQARALKIRTQITKLHERLKALSAVEMPKVILQELHDAENGRIDAQKTADFMGVPLKQLSDGLGLNYKAVHRSPSAPGFQQALRPVKRSLELLHEFFGPPDAIRAWLNTPHPDLDGTSALETILEGKADAVALLLENAWNGIPV